MKTKDVIQRLQQIDPTGELEVTIGKCDILSISKIAGYYDGCYQVLNRDPELEGKCYPVISAEIRSDGYHICIEEESIRDALFDCPEMPVTYETEYTKKHYEKRVEEWRKWSREAAEKDKLL